MRLFSLDVLVHTNEIMNRFCFWIYAILGVPEATRISPEFDEHFVFYLWISNIHRKYGLKFQEVWFNTSYKVIYLGFQTNVFMPIISMWFQQTVQSHPFSLSHPRLNEEKIIWNHVLYSIPSYTHRHKHTHSSYQPSNKPSKPNQSKWKHTRKFTRKAV